MSAPVSLAEKWAVSLSGLTARGKVYVHSRRSGGIRISPMELHALVELAEAYLAFVAADPYRDDESKAPEGHRRDAIMRGRYREYADARARLALAAKGVRP